MADAMTTQESTPSTTPESNASANNEQVVQSNVESSSNSGTTEVTKSFIETLPENLRGEKSLATFKTPEDLAKSYVNQAKLIGKKVTEMSADELKAIGAIQGIPESPDKYDFGKMEKQDDNLVNWFRKTAHEAGLPQAAAKKMVDAWNKQVEEHAKVSETQMNYQNEQYVEQLKKEFGASFTEKAELAKRAVHQFGGPDLVKFLDDNNLYNNPTLVKAFSEAGKLLKEGGFKTPENKGQFGMTPAEAQAKINELNNDRDFQNRKRSGNPEVRKAAIAELEQLYKLKVYVDSNTGVNGSQIRKA